MSPAPQIFARACRGRHSGVDRTPDVAPSSSSDPSRRLPPNAVIGTRLTNRQRSQKQCHCSLFHVCTPFMILNFGGSIHLPSLGKLPLPRLRYLSARFFYFRTNIHTLFRYSHIYYSIATFAVNKFCEFHRKIFPSPRAQKSGRGKFRSPLPVFCYASAFHSPCRLQ